MRAGPRCCAWVPIRVITDEFCAFRIMGLSRLFNGRGYSPRNVFNMTRFAEVFPDETTVHALSAQLSWTHLRRIIYIDDPVKRNFYVEMCRVEGWSTRMLLFSHRRLRRLVVIDLKLGRFKPAYKVQMELYLRWLEESSKLGLMVDEILLSHPAIVTTTKS